MIVAGPSSADKMSVNRQMLRHLIDTGKRVAYPKIDVVTSFENVELRAEFGDIDSQGLLQRHMPEPHGYNDDQGCPGMSEGQESTVFIFESTRLCLRCTPYFTHSLGVCILFTISGTHALLKIALSNMCVVTKTDLISQAEKEVFRENIRGMSSQMDIMETNIIQGTGMKHLFKVMDSAPVLLNGTNIELRGIMLLSVYTMCIGKMDVKWQNYFGVIRRFKNVDNIYHGE